MNNFEIISRGLTKNNSDISLLKNKVDSLSAKEIKDYVYLNTEALWGLSCDGYGQIMELSQERTQSLFGVNSVKKLYNMLRTNLNGKIVTLKPSEPSGEFIKVKYDSISVLSSSFCNPETFMFGDSCAVTMNFTCTDISPDPYNFVFSFVVAESAFLTGTLEIHKAVNETEFESTINDIRAKLTKVDEVIEENELIVATSLTDLDSRISDILNCTKQEFTEEQKAQARANINAQAELVDAINIKTINGKSIIGGGDLEIKEYDLSKIVDLGIFMGQSNMAGRGVTTTAHPEPAPVVPEGHGYEFKAISDPTKLYNLVEPFGVKENNPNGVTEGTKTGSMVAAFANAYYKYTHTPMVGVSCSKGGSNISQWQPGTAYLNDAIERYNKAKTWLTENGYTIRRSFMVWCQGEADSGLGTPEATYISQTKNTIEEMMKHGVEVCFVVRIGHYDKDYSTKDTDKDNNNMIRIQTEFCRTYKNAVMVSTDFAGMLAAGLMKDDQHYLQEGYNIAGTNAGEHAAFYINTGIEPYMYDVQYDNVYFPYAEVASKQPEYDSSLNVESINAVTNKAITSVINNINFLLSDFGERIQLLEDAGAVGGTVYTISTNLTNVICSNSSTQIVEGRQYNNVLSPKTNFEMVSVQVLMNGEDITETCYSDSRISIPNVTGNIVVIAVAQAIPLLNLDFRVKSLDEYIAEGVVSKNGEISSTHTAEGDKFTAVDSANLVLGKPLTFPTNFEIYLRLKTGEDFNNRYDDTGIGGGLALFNTNGNRPMINFRNEFDETNPYEGMGLQSRLVASGGDSVTITDVTIPTNDDVFHDVILHYENNLVWMTVDGVKSKAVQNDRTSNTVTHLLGYTYYYRPDNVTIACLKIYEV